MNVKSCKNCNAAFIYADGEEWKTVCISCYKHKKRQERQKENNQNQSSHNSKIVYRDRIIKEKIPDEMLNKLIRLCHPDKHKNSESSNFATKWLLGQRDL